MSTSTPEGTGRHIKSAIGSELLVRDVMTKGVITISKFDPVMQVADILTERRADILKAVIIKIRS